MVGLDFCTAVPWGDDATARHRDIRPGLKDDLGRLAYWISPRDAVPIAVGSSLHIITVRMAKKPEGKKTAGERSKNSVP